MSLNFFKSKKVKLVTHDGRFHADDVFATAALQLLFEKRGQKTKVFRSRDPKVWETGDVVYDTGLEYDPTRKIFDHHQSGGAGERASGVPYSSFGLIWKHYGEEIAGGKGESEIIDGRLVESIDIEDNAHDEYKSAKGFYLYSPDDIMRSFNPTNREKVRGDDENIANFLEAVAFAKRIIEREIAKAANVLADKNIADDIYNKTEDKRIIVIDQNISWFQSYCSKPEPIYVVQTKYGTDYAVRAVPLHPKSLYNRKPFPKSWGGKTGEELEKICGVKGAKFCHRTGFLCNAASKDAAIAMAKKALEWQE